MTQKKEGNPNQSQIHMDKLKIEDDPNKQKICGKVCEIIQIQDFLRLF